MEQYKYRIYSIGYATHTIESFINTLKKFNITAIADVRSQPYSKFKPEFNRENLKQALINDGIEYVFLGDNIGARIEAPECYKNEKPDYHLISKHPLFQKGVGRILKGMKKYLPILVIQIALSSSPSLPVCEPHPSGQPLVYAPRHPCHVA